MCGKTYATFVNKIIYPPIYLYIYLSMALQSFCWILAAFPVP
jgi:hypothetical protein